MRDARRLATAIRWRRWRPSPQGRLLAKELVACMGGWLPMDLGADLPTAMIRRASGAACAGVLGLPEVPKATALLEASLGVSAHRPEQVGFG